MERMHPDVITAEYRIAKRRPAASLSTTTKRLGKRWRRVFGAREAARDGLDAGRLDEIAAGIEIEDFRLDNVRERFLRVATLDADEAEDGPARSAPLSDAGRSARG